MDQFNLNFQSEVVCKETVVKGLASRCVFTQIRITQSMNIHTGNRTASLKLGGTESKCARCGKTVYFAEQVFGAGKKWHKHCFKCAACNKTVNSSTMRDKDGKENNHFIAKGFDVLCQKIFILLPWRVFGLIPESLPPGISNNPVHQILRVGIVYRYFARATQSVLVTEATCHWGKQILSSHDRS